MKALIVIVCASVLYVCRANQQIQLRAKPQIQLVPQGTEHGSMNSRIVGGSNAEDFPKWQVSLRRSGSHTCGAVIISRTKILTAAHCVDRNPSPSLYQVGVGHLERDKHIIYNISNIIIHSNYDSGGGAYPNDIAILTTSKEMEFGTDVGEIPRYSGNSNSLAGSDNCMLTGWGRDANGNLPDHLQELHINVLSDTHCKSYWGSNINNNVHVCVRDENGIAGACNGDSGGPLVCNGQLVGLASWVYSGCITTFPSVYVDVAHFEDWINTYL